MSETEARALQYRQSGLAFYRQFPNDPRRREWLLQTLERGPGYIRDAGQAARAMQARRHAWIEIDTDARQQWQTLYRSELRPAFLAATDVTDAMRARLLRQEYWLATREGERQAQRGEAVEVDAIADVLLQWAAVPGTHEESFERYLNMFLARPDEWRLDPAAQRRLLSRLGSTANPGLQAAVRGRSNIVRLYEEPLQMRLETLTGDVVDLAQWRGKVVLVDFWGTGCSSCIKAFPKIRRVYEQYHAAGFEVLGVVLDEESRRAQVQNILRDHAVPWPNALSPRSSGPHWRQYGFSGVPVMFLLERTGRLVTTEVGDGESRKLETLVRGLLASPAIASD